jgi:universal stress protein E
MLKAPTQILVALDGDDAITDVWREACTVGKTFGAELILVNAIPDAGEHAPAFEAVSAKIRELFEDLRQKGEAADVRVDAQFEIRSGAPAEVIVAVAKERAADLVMLGATTKGRLDRLLVGSTAEKVMRSAEPPVWLVRPGRGHSDVKTIVCAVDGSEAASEGLASAIFLARTFVAKLTLLGVAEDDEAIARFESGAHEYDLHGITMETLVLQGDVRQSILDAVSKTAADLLVLGEAGRTGLARLLKGNTAEAVVREVAASLLTVRPA